MAGTRASTAAKVWILVNHLNSNFTIVIAVSGLDNGEGTVFVFLAIYYVLVNLAVESLNREHLVQTLLAPGQAIEIQSQARGLADLDFERMHQRIALIDDLSLPPIVTKYF